MNRRLTASPDGVLARPHRYRISRAGVLNVWQYDDQVFDFADGRLLLRGANGAGKSKTLEMLLPFVLDGDRLRMTASGRHHTSLLWLMTDGYDGQGRTGYLWVEFRRTSDDGGTEWLTCGIGVRASQSARTVTPWYFTSPRRVGQDLLLEDETGPLTRDRFQDALGEDGHFFDSPRQYKEHVGDTLFGLTGPRYDELLRLLYWLRQPQIGEDIEPSRVAEILSVALPELEDDAVRAAGSTLDELAAFGEQLARQRHAAEAISDFADLYRDYARGQVADRGNHLLAAHRERRRLSKQVEQHRTEVGRLGEQLEQNAAEQEAAATAKQRAERRQKELERSPEARSHRDVLDLGERADQLRQQADTAGDNARRARAGADGSKQRLDRDAAAVVDDARDLATSGQQAASEAATLGARLRLAVPAALTDPQLPDRSDDLEAALGGYVSAVESVRPSVGELQAAVQVVEQARVDAESARRERVTAEREAGDAEAAAETERGRLADAKRAADTEEGAFVDALDRWRAAEHAVPFEGPGELSSESVAGIAAAAREAARPRIEQLSADESQAASRRVSAEESLVELRQQRAAIEAEPDPAPPPPTLDRTERHDSDGMPLWRLVDFPDDLDRQQRAGLEAGLESSGLLDAWVRVDGQVLDAEQRDVVLPTGPATSGRTLADVVVVELPANCPVTADTVRQILARVATVSSGVRESLIDGAAGWAAVGLDGAWRLGPLTGRAAKPAAQYVGATARAAERARRLAEIDARIDTTEQTRHEAEAAEQTARGRRVSIQEWLDDAPSYAALLRAWADLDAQQRATARADETARRAEKRAESARQVAAAARSQLNELAVAHGLPTTETGLAARREELRALDTTLRGQRETAGRLGDRLARWREDLGVWTEHDQQATDLEGQASDADREATAVAEQHAELREAVAASVRELEERLATVQRELGAAVEREKQLRQKQSELTRQHGAAERDHDHALQELAAQEPIVADAAHRVAALVDVPGLLESAGAPTDAGPYELARSLTPGEEIPADVIALARAQAGLELPERVVTAAAVLKRHTDVMSGPAADCEPRVLGDADPLAVVGRDESGEYPLASLASRLTAQVERDAELLTERERRLFEDHVLGELGESLRASRMGADELVAAMNGLLDGITTSQGVRVLLRWRLRDDVPEDARQAVDLIGRPIGALLPDERRTLRDAMHRLIEASRAEDPELSYTEHLGRALDYRQWFAFKVRYTRPELDGRWLDLHRRSPLSQGEQKVVCYLPLFAAAAAHFSSVAGAAPHAPRFVLLDDAFPKIDVRTHPLLFGLLVDLDLDFIVTSERLFGDYDTVPSLAVYEALRDPSERGIAQYEYRWDGRRMHTVGA